MICGQPNMLYFSPRADVDSHIPGGDAGRSVGPERHRLEAGVGPPLLRYRQEPRHHQIQGLPGQREEGEPLALKTQRERGEGKHTDEAIFLSCHSHTESFSSD